MKLRGVVLRAYPVALIPTPPKLPPRPRNKTALTPSSYDITKGSGQEASGDSGGIEMPTRLCSKCPLALRFGFLPENYWLCQRGQFALSQGDSGSPTRPVEPGKAEGKAEKGSRSLFSVSL